MAGIPFRPSGEPERRRAPRWPRGWGRGLVVLVGGWLMLRLFVVQAFDIPSGSMSNTLLAGDVMMVSKLLYGAEIPLTHLHLPAIREPRRGDIVIFQSVEGDFDMVKRLVGVPGDTLAMRGGHLIRNGVAVPEPFAVHTDSTRSEGPTARRAMRAWQLPHYIGPDRAHYQPDVQHWGPLVVPDGAYFMMGDNRDDSRDSRYWGFLPRENVLGTPLMVYFSYDPSVRRSMPQLSAIRWDRVLSRPR